MNDTERRKPCRLTSETAANNNVAENAAARRPGGRGASPEARLRRSRPSSPSRRIDCCERSPRPRMSAAAAQREREDASKYAVTGFAKDLLSAADNLRRALDSLPEAEATDERTRSLLAGVAATERELLAVFERHGIRRIDPEGRALRPQFPPGDLRGRAAGQARRHNRRGAAARLRAARPAVAAGDGRRRQGNTEAGRACQTRRHGGVSGAEPLRLSRL